MVNLVIVSHSQRLAEGVRELAGQMIFDNTLDNAAVSLDQEQSEHKHSELEHSGLEHSSPVHRSLSIEHVNQRVRIAVACAGEQADDCFGTSATSIADAIRTVWTEAGVLILVDLGSAVLNADLALELLPEEISKKCVISNAPLVEGAVAAALEASLGRPLNSVNDAAESASKHRKI